MDLSNLSRKLIFSFVTLMVLLLFCEGTVRLADLDARYFGNPFIGKVWWTEHLMPDPFVQWRGRPGLKVSWGSERLNKKGYRGPDFHERDRPGVRRVALLGDSCTFGLIRVGNNKYAFLESYPQILQVLLDEKYGRGRFEVLNYAHLGYTTYHGRRILHRETMPAEPDIVVIRFGWNDHSSSRVGYSYSDPENSLIEGLKYALYRSRLVSMVLFRGLPQFSKKKIWQSSPNPTVWVTAKDYERNLTRMIGMVRDRGAVPVLLDVPRGGLTPEIRRMRGYLKITGYDTFENYLGAHDRYQKITASVAERERVRFVRTELSSPVAGSACCFNRYDFAHPNAAGHARIARSLFKEISERVVQEETQ